MKTKFLTMLFLIGIFASVYGKNTDTTRIIVAVNKKWETAEVLNEFAKCVHFRILYLNATASEAYHADLDQPRAAFFMQSDTENIKITFYCIEDIIQVKNKSSIEKFKRLSQLFDKMLPKPEIVFSLSTGAYPDSVNSYNGCVAISTKYFMHSPKGYTDSFALYHRNFDKIVSNKVANEYCRGRCDELSDVALSEVPNYPAYDLRVLYDTENVALATVNVSNRDFYRNADRICLSEYYKKAEGKNDVHPVCIETTHGIVASASGYPTIFITGIANRLGWFSQEAKENQHKVSQNMAKTLCKILTSKYK